MSDLRLLILCLLVLLTLLMILVGFLLLLFYRAAMSPQTHLLNLLKSQQIREQSLLNQLRSVDEATLHSLQQETGVTQSQYNDVPPHLIDDDDPLPEGMIMSEVPDEFDAAGYESVPIRINPGEPH